MKLPLLKDAKVSGKTVFLRADLDVPLTKSDPNFIGTKFEIGIEDDTRLLAGLPTIEFLLKNGAKVIIGGHLGRPKIVNQESRQRRGSPKAARIMNQEFSLLPVAQWFARRFNHDSKFIIHNSNFGEFHGWEIGPSLFLLENLRFYAGEEENPTTGSGQVFAKKLASLADTYVNDAFAVSHRAHASIVEIPKYLPHFAGFRLQKEVEVLSEILENPRRPLVVIIGGAKMETKLPLVEKMHRFADFVLVGGKIAKEVKTLLKIKNKHAEEKHAVLVIGGLNKEKTDISNKSVREFLEIIKNAGTVVWNGPVGKIRSRYNRDEIRNSKEDTEKGTRELAKGIVKSKVYTVVGGGDTVGFLKRLKFLDRFSFVSTGGGAMLEFLCGGKLPGIEALTRRV